MSTPPFHKLAALLERVGFVRHEQPEAALLFAMPESPHWFLYRRYRDDEPIDPAPLLATRFQLDAWGYLDREAFDQEMRSHSLAG